MCQRDNTSSEGGEPGRLIKVFFSILIVLFLNLNLVYSMYFNKHCEILVSRSDNERNYIQAHGTACKLEAYCLWTYMQGHAGLPLMF